MQTLPPKKKKRRKWPWIVLAVVLVLLAAFVLSLRKTVAQSLTEEIAQRRDIITYYSFSLIFVTISLMPIWSGIGIFPFFC